MNTFYIYFWGLICHIAKKNNPNTRIHATLVHTPTSHFPTLIFSPTDLVSLTNNMRFKHGNGNAEEDPSFDLHVPSLLQILEKPGNVTDAKTSVYGKGGPNLHADYPKVPQGGSVKLYTVKAYERLGRHEVIGGGTHLERPVARLVLAEVKTDAAELVVQFNSNDQRTLRSDDETRCMIVANIEKPEPGHPQCDPDDNHFTMYSSLLENANEAIACDGADHVPTVEFKGCPWVDILVEEAARRWIRAATSTECGNTQWP